MYGIKVLLASAAIGVTLAAILLIWVENNASCGVATCKVLETIFIIVSLILTKQATEIKVK